jgi:hypothetical protein
VTKRQRIQKFHYLPTPDGKLVRKHRDALTAKEQEFVRNTKHLQGANARELQEYQDAAKELFAD